MGRPCVAAAGALPPLLRSRAAEASELSVFFAVCSKSNGGGDGGRTSSVTDTPAEEMLWCPW